MNVLSIDLDILFNCNEYAELMNYDISAQQAWKMIDVLGTTYNYDSKTLNKLVDIIKYKCNTSKVAFILEHDEIIDILRKNNCHEATLINADFHQDVSYNNNDNTLNIENWVSYAKQYHLIDKYHWVSRPLSQSQTQQSFMYSRTDIDDVDLDMIEDIDLLVFCFSRHFTPPKQGVEALNILRKNLKQDFFELGTEEINDFLEELKTNSFYKSYLVDNSLPAFSRLFRSSDGICVIEERVNDEIYYSMTSETQKANLFKIKRFLDVILDEYESICFQFEETNRNSIFIKRLAKQFKIIQQTDNKIKITKKEVTV